MSKQAQNERGALRNELQMKLEMIRKKEAALPDMIADLIPTAPYRNRVRDFCEALEAYIESLEIDDVDANTYQMPPKTVDADDYCADRTDLAACYRELIQALREFGIEVNIGEFGATEEFNTSQLTRLLHAVQILAQRLKELMASCGYGDDLTLQEAFRRVYLYDSSTGEFRTLTFSYRPCPSDDDDCSRYLDNPASARSADADFDAEGNIIIRVPEEQFGLTEIDAEIDMEWLIIHELGHAFHDRLPATISETLLCYHPGQPISIIDDENACQDGFVMRIPAGEVQAVIDFLVVTGGYWNPNQAHDFGDWRPQGPYTVNDAREAQSRSDFSIVPLTNENFRIDGVSLTNAQCGNITVFLVNRDGAPILENGVCVPFTSGQLPAAAVYARLTTAYVPQYQLPIGIVNLEQVQEYFGNETRLGNQHPREGFADAFANTMRYEANPAADLLDDDPRLTFFNQDQMCGWLYQILGEPEVN
jgi:hypothetical protein